MNFKFLLGLALIIPFAHAAEDGQNRKRPQRSHGQELASGAKRQETVGSADPVNSLQSILQDDASTEGSSSSSGSSNESPDVHKYSARIYKTLIRRGSSHDDIIKNPILESTKIGNVDFIKFLLAAGFETDIKNDRGMTALHLASKIDHLEIAKLLIEAGADIEAKDNNGWTPLHYASRDGLNSAGQPLIFEYLIALGADKEAKDTKGCTPLHHASDTKQLHVVNRLIRAGAIVDVKDNNGMTPLHFVIERGHYCIMGLCDVIKNLLKAGADIEAKDNNDWTPLHFASRAGRPEIVKCLLKAGADKESKNNFGRTPLHVACQNAHLNVIEYLLVAGADKEVSDRYYQKPLHVVCIRGNFEIVKCLLAAGANKMVKDRIGETPLHKACYNGHFEVVKFLVEEQGLDATPFAMKAAKIYEHMNVLAYLMHTSGKFNGQSECTICLNSIKEHPKTTACCFNGTYCTRCIAKVLKRNNACPMCREKNLEKNIIDIQEVMAHYVPEVHVGTSTVDAMQPTCSSSDMPS